MGYYHLESQVMQPEIGRHLFVHRIGIARQIWNLIGIRMCYRLYLGNLCETIVHSCHTIYLFVAMLPRHYIVRKGIATVMHWDLDLFRCQNIGLTSSVCKLGGWVYLQQRVFTYICYICAQIIIPMFP